jgi:transcriptional regulator with XRE-family HTH domain
MQIFERIKKAREKSGLTPEALAAKIGVPRTTYLYWEESTPKPEKVMSVAKALGLPEYYFFIPDETEKDDKADENIDNKVKTADLIGTTTTGHTVYVQAKDLAASYERIIEEKERMIKLIESHVDKAEKDKNRLFKALEDAQKTINEVLKPIKEQTQEILANSKEVRENTIDGIIEMQSEHRVIMDTLDQIAKQPIGTTYGKADILEGAAQEIRKKDHKKKSAHK